MENELYSPEVGTGEYEFEVIIKPLNGRGSISVYVYAENETDAKHQAKRQGIEPNRVKAVKLIGKRKDFGHI